MKKDDYSNSIFIHHSGAEEVVNVAHGYKLISTTTEVAEYYDDDLFDVWEICMKNIRKLQSVVDRDDVGLSDRMACMALIRDYAEVLPSLYEHLTDEDDEEEDND